MGETVEKMVPNCHIVEHKLVHLHFDEITFLINGSKVSQSMKKIQKQIYIDNNCPIFDSFCNN